MQAIQTAVGHLTCRAMFPITAPKQPMLPNLSSLSLPRKML